MANDTNRVIVELGTVIKNRNNYSDQARYFKDNVVQYEGGSYIAQPTSLVNDGVLDGKYYLTRAPFTTNPQTPSAGWSIFATGKHNFASGEDIENISIATNADFVNPDSTSRAKVPTVGTMLDGMNDGVYDVSARNSGATFDSLNDLLSNANLNTLIPSAWRKGGMSIRFVQNSDNNSTQYVQYRYMGTSTAVADFTNVANWQGVDENPVAGSKNLVESGGVAKQINEMWYEKIDASSVNITNSSGIITSGTYIGTVYYNTSYSYTDYIDISNANGGYIKVTTITNPSALGVGLVFYNESKEPLAGYNFAGEKSNQLHEIAIPQGAKYIRNTLWKDTDTYGGFGIYFLKERQSLPDKFNDTNKELEDIISVNVYQQQQIEELKGQIMNMDKNSVISVDLMQFCHGLNRLSSLDYMSIVSSTSDSITLSASDAESFSDNVKCGQCVAIGFSNGSYKMVFFGNRSGNTIPRASFDNTDLTNAIKVQSLHDTLSQGQHLSPSGYLAMANFVATEIEKRTSLVDKNWLGGIIFNEMKTTTGYQNTNANNWVYDANDNVVCKPVFYNWLWGGYTPNGNNTSNGRGIGSESVRSTANGWVTKCYRIIQGKKDAYIEFPISLKGAGFVEIQAAKLAEKTTSTGDCKMSVYADGVLIGEETLAMSLTKYIFENVTVNNELRVRFTILDNVDTDVVIYSIGMWEMHSNVSVPSINGSTIAVLGDSWTQFPSTSTALSDHEDYNVIVTRPDGTTGNGCGYFPKELARLTGSTVDNWGKANMRADDWGLEKIDTILNYKSYDFLIIEFFINDLNANISKETWASNIKSICRKCQRKGTRPVFIMPCGTNGINQTTELGKWHEYVLKGLDVN